MAYEQEEGERPERKYSEEQYQMLLRCSEKKDMTEWNEWRNAHPDEDVRLEGANLNGYWLKSVNLGTHRQYECKTPEIYIKKARLNGAHLEGANLTFAHLEGAELHEAHLEEASLNFVRLNNALLLSAHLEKGKMRCGILLCANLCNAHLEGADACDTRLQGAEMNNAHLEGAKFRLAAVDGATSVCYCSVDRETDFREVGLGTCRIDAGTKQLLQYNVRRMNWEDWYKGHWFWRWPVRWFWALSDYGRSTGWVIAWFFILALIFALIYFVWGLAEPPGIVSNLFELEGTTQGGYKYAIVDMTTIERQPGEPIKVSKGTAFVRTIYFSVVTMTTLGFGDLYANPLRIAGHILLALQVILGYVLLGALITRFAVLFTAGGPAGRFSKEKGEVRRENGEWKRGKWRMEN